LHNSREAQEGVVEKAILQKIVQQNRGQTSAGLMTLRNMEPEEIGERLALHIEPGTVEEAFHLREAGGVSNLANRMAGIAAVGQVRYSTVYKSEKDRLSLRAEGQPMRRPHSNPAKNFGIVYNGTLANNRELRDWLVREKNQTFSTAVDTETLLNLEAIEIKENMIKHGGRDVDLFEVTERLFRQLDGGYSVINLFANGDMLAFRGPEGIRPLKFGENGDLFAFASESPALEILGINKWHDVPRGSAIIIDKAGKIEQRQIVPDSDLPRESRCRVEAVYFATGDSDWDGRKVSAVRRAMGMELARRDPLVQRILDEKPHLDDNISREFVIVPIPKTGTPIGEGYQQEIFRQTGVFVPLLSALEKRFGGRMFIMGAEERARLKKIGLALHGGVNGKSVIGLDDSQIRGQTLEGIGQNVVLAGGAKEFHARLGDGVYRYPCFYGIDFPTTKELAVHKYGLSDIRDIDELEVEIAKKMGIASVRFQREEGSYRALGMGKDRLCMACQNGEYPTACGQRRFAELQGKS